MTNETNMPGSGSDGDEARLSRLYRSSATERTPTHLDARVLAAARRGARTRYWTATHWLRPMAWAATIGLCLAIVIELSTVPDEAFDMPYAPPPDSAKPGEPAALPIEAPASRSEEQPAAERDEQKSEYRILAVPAAAAEDEQPAAPGNRQTQDPGVTSRMRAAPEIDSDVLAESAGIAAAAELSDSTATLCPAEDIAAPDKWLECIAGLEAEGRTDEAASERRRFDLKYPDYDVD